MVSAALGEAAVTESRGHGLCRAQKLRVRSGLCACSHVSGGGGLWILVPVTVCVCVCVSGWVSECGSVCVCTCV